MRRPPTSSAAAMLLAAVLAAAPAAAQSDAAPVRLDARPERVQVVKGGSAPLDIVALDAAGREVAGAEIRIVAARGALRWSDGRVEGLEAGQHRVIAPSPGRAPSP